MSDNSVDDFLPAKVDQETTLDRLQKWYIKGETYCRLTPKEEEQRTRYEAAFAMLCNYKSPEQVVPLHMKAFKLSKATAWRDINEALRLFGDVRKSSKEGWRHVIFEYAIKTFQLALDQKPPDLDQLNKAIANMIKLKGLDRDDPDMPDWSSLQGHTYNLNLPAEVLSWLVKLTEMGAINLAELRRNAPKTIDVTANESK